MKLENRILLFDGVCNLCNGFVQFVIKHDPEAKFKFAALQSGAGRGQLKRFGLPEKYMESFIYIRGDKYYRKSTAVLNMWKDLGGGWRLTFGFMVFPAVIRDFFYDVIAKSRYKMFGKRDTCMIPTPDLQKRFLQ